MPKPSEQIRNIVPGVARQRLAKAKASQAASGPQVLLMPMEEKALLETLAQDPLTWVMAIMAYLDSNQQDADARNQQVGQEMADLMQRVDGIDRALRNHLDSVI